MNKISQTQIRRRRVVQKFLQLRTKSELSKHKCAVEIAEEEGYTYQGVTAILKQFGIYN